MVKEKSLEIGEFTGPAGAEASGGPGLQLGLTAELKKLGVKLDKNASLELTGVYGKAKNRKTTSNSSS